MSSMRLFVKRKSSGDEGSDGIYVLQCWFMVDSRKEDVVLRLLRETTRHVSLRYLVLF